MRHKEVPGTAMRAFTSSRFRILAPVTVGADVEAGLLKRPARRFAAERMLDREHELDTTALDVLCTRRGRCVSGHLGMPSRQRQHRALRSRAAGLELYSRWRRGAQGERCVVGLQGRRPWSNKARGGFSRLVRPASCFLGDHRTRHSRFDSGTGRRATCSRTRWGARLEAAALPNSDSKQWELVGDHPVAAVLAFASKGSPRGSD